jgi:DNA polymerase III subunit epsilon
MAEPSLRERHARHFDRTWDAEAAADEVRFVALDSETTGLDPRKDRLVTIGAVAVIGGEIRIEDSFEALLKVEYNTSSVTIHGVTRDDSRRGLDEAEVLGRLVPYLRDGVIVGHHVGHDVATLDVALERHFGFTLQNGSLDTMDLALNLERDGAFGHAEPFRAFSLDALCARFDIVPHGRHTATGDAFLTALVFQRLIRLAARFGRGTLGRLREPFVAADVPESPP